MPHRLLVSRVGSCTYGKTELLSATFAVREMKQLMALR